LVERESDPLHTIAVVAPSNRKGKARSWLTIFQLHGVNVTEEPTLRKKLRRKEMVASFEKLPSTW